jgi:S1-C subfamily serine protease
VIRSRLNRPIDYKGLIVLFFIYYTIRSILSESATPVLGDFIFAVLVIFFLRKRIHLLKFMQEFFEFIYGLRFWIAVLFTALILTYLFYEQKEQITQLTEKISVIEKKLGGSERLVCNEKDAITTVKKSVVRVVGGEGEGSGFAIQEGGYILTNFHVIEFEPSPKVVFPDNTFQTAEVLMVDKTADLAILKVERNLQPLNWGDPKLLNPAEELLAIGFPLGGELIGEATVNKGALSARRKSKDVGVEYIQTDAELISGMSGGPMVNICGEVVGINTMGLSGLGLAISSDSIREKWIQMSLSETAQEDIQRITFDPDASALESVRAFYNYLKVRKLEKAFELLSDNFKRGYKFTTWKAGYDSLLDTSVIKIEEDPAKANRIQVKLSTSDMVDGEIVYKFFEGYWDVRENVNKWELWDAEIAEVEDPSYMWFYE